MSREALHLQILQRWFAFMLVRAEAEMFSWVFFADICPEITASKSCARS